MAARLLRRLVREPWGGWGRTSPIQRLVREPWGVWGRTAPIQTLLPLSDYPRFVRSWLIAATVRHEQPQLCSGARELGGTLGPRMRNVLGRMLEVSRLLRVPSLEDYRRPV